MKVKYPKGYKITTIVLDNRLFMALEYFKTKIPHYNLSDTVAKVIVNQISEYETRGIKLPEDLYDAIIQIHQEVIDDHTIQKNRIETLKKRAQVYASNTLAGAPTTGCKPGYHLEDGMVVEDD